MMKWNEGGLSLFQRLIVRMYVKYVLEPQLQPKIMYLKGPKDEADTAMRQKRLLKEYFGDDGRYRTDH